MRPALFALLVAVLTGTPPQPVEAKDKAVQASGSLMEVRLANSSTLEIAGFEIHGNYVWFTLPGGSKVAYERADVDLSSDDVAKMMRETANVWVGTNGARGFRAVTHYWIGPGDVRTFLAVLERVLERA